MEVDDAGNAISGTIHLESLESSPGESNTELNDSNSTSLSSNFCPHCSRSLAPFAPSDSRTHPKSLTIAHAEWSDLRANLNEALLNKFNKGPYTVVEALLLTWAANDQGPKIEEETKALCSVFEHDHHFKAKHHTIPSMNSGSKVLNLLAPRIADLEDKSQESRTLFIVYYNGHGAMKDDKLIWAALA